MDIKEFSEIIKERLEERTGLEVRLVEVTKNNSVILHGINIIVPDCNILPTIYMEPYLEAYEQNMSLEKITEKIINVWEREKEHNHLDVEWFRDFEQAKERVVYKLVNYEANRKMLENVPHVPFLNLAKVFYVAVYSEEFGNGSILIHNNHQQMWGVTTEELNEIATENTPKLFPAEVIGLEEILRKAVPEMAESFDMPEQEKPYMISNKEKSYGAAVMCYPSIIKEFAEQRKSDLIIIPSSVHELLVLPYEDGTDSFKEMVREVNNTKLEPEDILSYSVYVYRRATDSISIA